MMHMPDEALLNQVLSLREEIIDFAVSSPGPVEGKIVVVQLTHGKGSPCWLLRDETDLSSCIQELRAACPEVVEELQACRNYSVEEKKGKLRVVFQHLREDGKSRVGRLRFPVGAGAA